MAEALHSAHINAIEIPLDMPDAVGVIAKLVQRFDEEMLVGAGGVLDVESADTVIAAGASFVTSPSCDVEVVKYCNATDLAVFPGALTPTEILSAWKAGADMVRVFPCSALGGPSYLKALKAPLPQIDLFPSGGVTLQNAAAFIDAGACVLGVGRDLVDLTSLREGRLDRIAERAHLFMELVRDARGDMPTPPPATVGRR
jgi:2-dehydro-3-deoxyphosphogluconate aldolase/(4S)-4-hydroxy-2-oxoglutarate aldolase